MAANGTTRTNMRKPAAPQAPTYRGQTQRQRAQARQKKTSQNQGRTRTTNKTRNIHVTINKPGAGGAGGGGAQGQWSRSSPIGDAEFLSAGHVRAFAERGRKAMRQAAMDFSYAHEALRAVLREVPPPQGESRGQMYLKANRTARSLKRAANAAQAASAHSARTWPAFMREYEPWLNQFGGPRPQQRRNINFGA
ncbi:plasmid transfer protein TraA [Streptomyces sp. NPDC004324]